MFFRTTHVRPRWEKTMDDGRGCDLRRPPIQGKFPQKTESPFKLEN